MVNLAIVAARLVGAGALLAFGWIFGEHGATKLVEHMEARRKAVKAKSVTGKV